MRLLIVTQYFWPEDFRINDLALALLERGHRVTVLTGKPNYPSGQFLAGYGFLGKSNENYKGAAVVRVPLLPRGDGGSLRLALNYASFAIFATLLGALLCREEYDVILVYEPSPVTVGLPALWLKRLRGAPILFWVQDLWPQSLSATGAVRSALVLRWVEKLVRLLYRGCDRILVQSRAFFEPIELLGVERDRIRYFPNTAEPLYRPVPVKISERARHNLPGGFIVMFAGNIGAAQDFETIVEAAELLRGHEDIHWVILGDGRMYSWVKRQVADRELLTTFHLLGRHPPETMPRYFAMADAMLVTLKRDPIFAVTIPSKIQAYLACGRPIVAALDGEGARVINEAEAGLTVPAQDSASLAQAVLRLARMDPAEREALGAHGRSYFEKNFERDMLLDRLEGWLREISGKRLACAS
jgi:colanic acid biosynthesis glycosyl transferase WcaI